jgi:hypothetical protein
MAQTWGKAQCDATYTKTGCTPGGWLDGHGWYTLIAPYIEETAWSDLIHAAGQPLGVDGFEISFSHQNHATARRTLLPIHACPSDVGLQRNEWDSANWARVRTSYVVNAGNTVYGQFSVFVSTNPEKWVFGGAPFRGGKKTKVSKITDGLSNTEKNVLPELPSQTFPGYWGGPHSDTNTALGGQVFTGFYPPNSSAPDYIARTGEWLDVSRPFFLENEIPIPVEANTLPPAPRGTILPPIAAEGGIPRQTFTARSHHPGGVNASRCDGSADFVSDNIDEIVWNARTSAAGGETISN